MRKRKKLICALMVIAIVVVMSACSTGGSNLPASSEPGTKSNEEKISSKDTLIMGADREPVSLDPSAVTVSYAQLIENQIYDTLIRMDENLNIVPELAESWEQVDELTWKFNLRKGIKFHNGEEMTSKDVLFSFKRLYNLPPGSTAVEYINPNGYETPDDYTFILKTTKKYAFLEAQLCDNALSILNEKAVIEAGDNYGRNPIGTGPFKFASWSAGDNITVERFDDYWGEPAKLNKIVFRIITENSARTINLESGDIDFCLGVLEADADRIANGENTVLFTDAYAHTRYFAFHCRKDVFKDKRVRQAMVHATDLETIRKVIYGENTSTPSMITPVPPKLKGRNEDLKGYEYDVAKAKALLAEAGVAGGFEVNYIYLANTNNNMIAEMLQAMWKEVGVTLKLNPMESGALSTAMNKGEQEFCLAGTLMDSFQAGKGLYDWFHSSSIGKTSNRSYLDSSEVDALLDKIVIETDEDKRAELVYQAQALIAEECPLMVICHQHVLLGMDKNLRGFNYTPTQNFELSTVYFVEE